MRCAAVSVAQGQAIRGEAVRVGAMLGRLLNLPSAGAREEVASKVVAVSAVALAAEVRRQLQAATAGTLHVKAPALRHPA